jgi:two-component system response regulator HupR/HoxA
MSSVKKQEAQWIIAVDDDEAVLEDLKRSLNSRYRLSLFTSPNDALEAVRAEGCPHLVITDQRMASMKGTELLEEILKLHPESVGMIVTGFTEKGDLIGAINEARVFAYVVKPWTTQGLLATVERALRMSAARRAKKTLNEDLSQIRKTLSVLNSEITADKDTLAESFAAVRVKIQELSKRSAELQAAEHDLLSNPSA